MGAANLPFTHEFPYHADSDATTEHLVERCVARCDHFAAVAHDISQRVGLAAQGASDGIDDLLHGLRCQSAPLRNIKDGKEEHIRDGDEAACVVCRNRTAAAQEPLAADGEYVGVFHSQRRFCYGGVRDARTLFQCRMLAGGYSGYRR